MSSSTVFVHPPQHELTEFFGVEPAESAPGDGYWAYDVRDGGGVGMRFSFNGHERSVQIALRGPERELMVVSQEGACHMEIDSQGDQRILQCGFGWQGAESVLRLAVRPAIAIR